MDEQTAAILDERARRHARPLDEAGLERADLLAFAIGEARFALPVDGLAGARTRVRLEVVPGLPAWVAGLVAIRGRVLSAIWLDLLFGGPAADVPRSDAPLHALVLRAGEGEAAILATTVEGIVREPREGPLAVPPGVAELVLATARGTLDGRLVLDPIRLATVMRAALRDPGGHAHIARSSPSRLE